jgi:hypothetical protein
VLALHHRCHSCAWDREGIFHHDQETEMPTREETLIYSHSLMFRLIFVIGRDIGLVGALERLKVFDGFEVFEPLETWGDSENFEGWGGFGVYGDFPAYGAFEAVEALERLIR